MTRAAINGFNTCRFEWQGEGVAFTAGDAAEAYAAALLWVMPDKS